MAPGKAPVDRVGGTLERGPWPAEVEEIVESKAYRRPVTFGDGTRQEVEVDVRSIGQLIAEDGTPEGYAVRYQYDNPTLSGGD